ncbi:Vacuolar protein sorting-associated protein 52 A [Gracilariopsis chorda]|uniref:Vacuolar protein sorting-associated protein 52 A n=1 Tax=Gracilariopsis chorda TaxID=448386 RepID=A0A2V3J0M7_9FLOR|nr:Vacuolar protein sorting-associated protein 52 A [Gracilariopsis chorda]|eukprot:PXF46920.1 Vacuolar protein sorting-associated protein 52 A [Gracilariopsis chorda]
MTCQQTPPDPHTLWNALGLSNLTHSPLSDDALRSFSPERLPTAASEQTKDDYDHAVSRSLHAYEAESETIESVISTQSELKRLQDATDHFERLAHSLHQVETDAIELQNQAKAHNAAAVARNAAYQHLTALLEELVIPPSLIRHIVDGRVSELEYGACLTKLSKKVALYDMGDLHSTPLHEELAPVLQALVHTAVARTRTFLLEKIALLKRPNTNVNIVKENVLLKHRALVEFIEMHHPHVFAEIKEGYVETMSRTYYVLFRKYADGLLTMKQLLPSENADTLVGSMAEETTSLFSRHQPVPVGGVSQFALGDRLEVLHDVEGPAIVLATAVDNNQRFYYEQIHRSLGKMLSEACASEHIFCKAFFGESNSRMFNTFFKRIIGFLLDAVKAHTEPTRDAVGVLLALKVNEAQKRFMQERSIMYLSDFFIQADIILKPKFKKLLDENVASVTRASATIARQAQRRDIDTSPHIVTRRFAAFSSSMLAISRFGTPDDSILEGLRSLRNEYNGFLNTASTLFARPRIRCVFLINNVDLVLSMFRRHGVLDTNDYKFFAEFQEVHSAAYVEHEVADHFPDVVVFVRQCETIRKNNAHGANARPSPSKDRVKSILRQFAANWRLGVQHMQGAVLRDFPNFDVGTELTRGLFAKLLAYHKRCENAVDTYYPQLKSEIVTGTEIVYELRQRTKGTS